MDSFLNYLIEANIGLLLFLVCYQSMLKIETSYRFTRFFLLAGIFVSVVFPLIHAYSKGEASMFSLGRALPSLALPVLAIDDSSVSTASQETGHIGNLWIWIYASVSLLFAVGFISKLRTITNKMVSSQTYRRGKFRICESEASQPTFSFFNFIFLGESHRLTSDEKEQILQHEMVHASHYHSIDIIAIQLARILFWFNPLLSAYKNAIVQTHEFEADSIAAKTVDSDEYCHLLAKISLRSNGFILANHFNHSLTVKRIAMIRTVKSKMSFWKTSLCSVMIPAAFLLLSCQDQLRNADNEATPYEVDEHAYPADGFEAFYNEMRRNVRYPASSRKDQNYGRVLVQFVVKEDGTLSDMEVLESPDKALAEEGLRVLSLVPEWIPARRSGVAVKERIVMPIEFRLSIDSETPLKKTDVEQYVKDPITSLEKVVVIGYTN